MAARCFDLGVAGTTLPLPCFVPSVSSVKTSLMPVDYVEVLSAASYPVFLVSAFDIANSCAEHRQRIHRAIKKSTARRTVIFMDSGKYEAFWKGDLTWTVDRFHAVCQTYKHDLCFCYDNQEPPETAEEIAQDVVTRVLHDQEHSVGTVVPIVHGPADLLPAAAKMVAEHVYPVLIAVPERALGDGILARTRSVRSIRRALDTLDFYYPLHLLGTGNPISMVAYAVAGADSFDGLEWCQTVVDYRTRLLFHFQQWDFFREQTKWGNNNVLPYTQSVLMHNLEFFSQFMQALRVSLIDDTPQEILERYLPEEHAKMILDIV